MGRFAVQPEFQNRRHVQIAKDVQVRFDALDEKARGFGGQIEKSGVVIEVSK